MHIRAMSPEDFGDVVSLQRACFPDPFPEDQLWTLEHLRSHHRRFPEGQIVAVEDNQVIGTASNCQITLATWNSHLSWDETVGGFSFEGHDPNGEVLFGADISVHPGAQGRGVGRALYAARFELVRQQGLSLFGTACRMPDFASAAFSTPHEYAQSVVRGGRSDRTLTPLLRMGLSFAGVIENHMDDVESGHAAATLEWRP